MWVGLGLLLDQMYYLTNQSKNSVTRLSKLGIVAYLQNSMEEIKMILFGEKESCCMVLPNDKSNTVKTFVNYYMCD